MKRRFKSDIFCGGHLFKPDILEIDNQKVIYKKRHKYIPATQLTISIPLLNIVSVDICDCLNGLQITIRSFSSNSIIAKGFSVTKAHEIKRLIQQ